MINFNKNRSNKDKSNISHSMVKEVRRLSAVKTIKITKENKRFLKDLGFKLQNAADHRPTTS